MVFTLITTLLDPEAAPAAELAALSALGDQIAYDEIKTHMLGPGALAARPRPSLQELEGLMHYAVIHERPAPEPTRTDYPSSTVNVVRRRIVHPGAFSPTGDDKP